MYKQKSINAIYFILLQLARKLRERGTSVKLSLSFSLSNYFVHNVFTKNVQNKN